MIQLYRQHREVTGTVRLPASKSISNRALIIRALSGEDTPITNLSDAADTQVLLRLLETTPDTYDVGHAGTTFRFLLSHLALQPGRHVLTGSERMQQRPIGPLVDALRDLGAAITYLNREGYPPLLIETGKLTRKSHLVIPATVSSQFISSLLMVAPLLPDGLRLSLEGNIVSRSYIEMTLAIMATFGVSHSWEGQEIIVPRQTYRMHPFEVESDWSAASYFYAIAAFADSAEITLAGLRKNSLQGDAAIAEIMEIFGVHTVFDETGAHLTKVPGLLPPMMEWDFLNCPDIAQTVAVICAGTGVRGLFSGLETLSIKETDRIAALKTELAKIGASFVRFSPRFAKKSAKTHYYITPNETALPFDPPVFDTYDDHRMAMAFAPLAILYKIGIRHPEVVKKSYPGFWGGLQELGIVVESLKS